MPQSTITSKGQVTLPAEIRAQLNLQTGDRLNFEIDHGALRVVPVGKGTLDDFMDILPKSSRVVPIEEMNEAIAEGSARGGA